MKKKMSLLVFGILVAASGSSYASALDVNRTHEDITGICEGTADLNVQKNTWDGFPTSQSLTIVSACSYVMIDGQAIRMNRIGDRLFTYTVQDPAGKRIGVSGRKNAAYGITDFEIEQVAPLPQHPVGQHQAVRLDGYSQRYADLYEACGGEVELQRQESYDNGYSVKTVLAFWNVKNCSEIDYTDGRATTYLSYNPSTQLFSGSVDAPRDGMFVLRSSNVDLEQGRIPGQVDIEVTNPGGVLQ